MIILKSQVPHTTNAILPDPRWPLKEAPVQSGPMKVPQLTWKVYIVS